jgi:hypothetical protein
LTYASLQGADLGKARLKGALGLTQGQVDSANGNEYIQLPLGVDMPKPWKQVAEDPGTTGPSGWYDLQTHDNVLSPAFVYAKSARVRAKARRRQPLKSSGRPVYFVYPQHLSTACLKPCSPPAAIDKAWARSHQWPLPHVKPPVYPKMIRQPFSRYWSVVTCAGLGALRRRLRGIVVPEHGYEGEGASGTPAFGIFLTK